MCKNVFIANCFATFLIAILIAGWFITLATQLNIKSLVLKKVLGQNIIFYTAWKACCNCYEAKKLVKNSFNIVPLKPHVLASVCKHFPILSKLHKISYLQIYLIVNNYRGCVMVWSKGEELICAVVIVCFPVWLQNQIISAGLGPVLSLTEK